MKISSTNKKIIVFGAFFLLFTVIVGVVFRYDNKENFNQESVAETEFIRGYKVEDLGSAKVLKNEEAGFSLLIPENWIVKNYDYKINLLSSELEYKEGINPLDKAKEDKICTVNVQIAGYEENSKKLTDLSSLVERVGKGEIKEEADLSYGLVNAGGRVFLVTTYKKNSQIIYISAKTIDSNNIYSVDSGLIFSENCVESFNNTLNTVKIDYNK